MADIAALRASIMKRAKVGERQLLRLIQAKESETLLPRNLAIMALAVDQGLSIRRYATDDDLAQLRAAAGRSGPVPAGAAQASPQSTTTVTPSRNRRPPSGARPKPQRATRGRKVFVVHGRDNGLRQDLFAFLRSIGLEPLEWGRGIAATKKASPSISQILDAMFEQAIAVVVLLTPDDEVRLKPEFQKVSDPPFEKELVGQARPNVLFEAGMAFGRHPESTVLIQVGVVKPFSDVGGLHVTYLNNSPESRSELVTKLTNAGCATETDSTTDWYTTGDFESLEVSEE